MSTNCMIAYHSKAVGDVVATYCHYDGYPEGVGHTLASHYNGEFVAESVSIMGYLSALKPDLGQSVAESANHEPPREYESLDEFLSEMAKCPWIEYVYVWADGGWKVLSATHAVSPIQNEG